MPRSGSGRDMGFGFVGDKETCYKRKHRWLFFIDDICGDGVPALPPAKAIRPSISFKEMEAQHLTETVYFPGKPEWKPLTLTLYDILHPGIVVHPVFEWLKEVYDPENDAQWVPSCDGFKRSQARLEMYDGCGEVMERWILETVWPQSVEFGDLDMTTSDILTCDVTLRYDRAYIVQNA